MTEATETRTKKKKGLFSRFRKKDKKDKTEKSSSKVEKVEEPTPPPSPEPQEESRQSKSKKSFTKEGIPVVTGDNPDDFVPSDARKTIPGEPAVTKSKKKSKKKKAPPNTSIILDHAPTARQSAFSGPPRYDWIDVVRRLSLIVVLLAFDRHGQVVFFLRKPLSISVHVCDDLI